MSITISDLRKMYAEKTGRGVHSYDDRRMYMVWLEDYTVRSLKNMESSSRIIERSELDAKIEEMKHNIYPICVETMNRDEIQMYKRSQKAFVTGAKYVKGLTSL